MKKCLMCREEGVEQWLFGGQTTEGSMNQAVFQNWSESCMRSVCRILKMHEWHPFVSFFRAAHYCQDCVQELRDLESTLKQLDHCRKKVSNTRQNILRKLQENFDCIKNPEKIPPDVNYQNIEADKCVRETFSFNEVVKVIYEKFNAEESRWTDSDFILAEENAVEVVVDSKKIKTEEIQESKKNNNYKSSSKPKDESSSAYDLKVFATNSWRKNENQETETENNDKNTIPCYFNGCLRKFSSKNALNAHMKTHRDFHCGVEGCERVYSNSSRLVEIHDHMQTEHPPILPYESQSIVNAVAKNSDTESEDIRPSKRCRRRLRLPRSFEKDLRKKQDENFESDE